jgi:NAD(P)-dependent dehydrogenase (short-subunit alcohol dehydrogenase family)
MKEPIVLVTGGNRGIGLEIARQLAQRGARVILTARKKKAGEEALSKLKGEGLKAEFHELDVSKAESISGIRSYVTATHRKLDVLINNAGILADADTSVLEVDVQTVRKTLETNTIGPLLLAQALAPLLAKSKAGRIVNISSGMGAISDMGSDHAAYRLSKAALNAVTAMLGAALPKVAVNSACPGWVRTDMGGASAERNVAQGADTPVWLALEAPQTLTGKFVRDRQVIDW